MSQRFVKGQKSKLSALTSGTDLYVGVHVDAPGATWDISCFGLDAPGRLSDDRYFVFFNQPESPEGALRKLGPQQGDTDSFRVLLDTVPATIGRLSFCAATDAGGTANGVRSGYVRLVVDGTEVARYAFAGGEFGAERAIMIADLYRKDGWRFGAVGQGFAGGLADLIRNFGGTVDDEPAPSAPGPESGPPQQAPTAPNPPQASQQTGAAATLGGFHEVDKPGERWVKQNPYLVRVTLGPDCHARRGSMVAYQGNVKFEYKGSGGLRALFEGAATGQQLRLMTCKGQGDVFLAEDATNLHVLRLDGQTLCVNANNVLAFDATLQTALRRIESPAIPGGGMFHLEVGGQGTVVVMTRGTPVTLPVRGPTYADMNALVAWTAGMRVSASTQLRISRQAYAGGPAEGIALQFMAMGDHFIVVQPYEV